MTLRTTLVLLLALPCGAQNQEFVAALPPSTAFDVKHAVYDVEGKLEADVFLPAASSPNPRPVFIIFNGFGGSFMRQSPQAQSWAKAAAAHGFVAVTEDTTAGHISADFNTLAAFLEKNARQFQLDPARIAVIAWSGNVPAAMETLQAPTPKSVKAAIFYYGTGEVSSIRFDLPTLFVRAGLDQPAMNHEIDHMIATGLAANAPWTILNYPAGHHGFDVVDDNDLSREIIEHTFRFAEVAVSDRAQSALLAGLPEATASGVLEGGDFRKAAALYQPVAVARPQDARVRLAYGNALLGAGMYKEARIQFDHAKTIGGLGARDLGIPAAKACALDHDPDCAIAWLKTIPAQFLPESTESDADFATLRDRADFRALFGHR